MQPLSSSQQNTGILSIIANTSPLEWLSIAQHASAFATGVLFGMRNKNNPHPAPIYGLAIYTTLHAVKLAVQGPDMHTLFKDVLTDCALAGAGWLWGRLIASDCGSRKQVISGHIVNSTVIQTN